MSLKKKKKKTEFEGGNGSFQSISSYLFPHSIVYMLYLEYKNKSLLKTFLALDLNPSFQRRVAATVQKRNVWICV